MAWQAFIPAGISLISSLLGKGKSSTPSTINGLPAQSGLPGVSGGTDWAGILAGVAPGLLEGLSDASTTADAAARSREQLEEQRRQFDATLAQNRQTLALNATQLDPLAQQKSRQNNAVRAALVMGGSPYRLSGNTFSGGFQWGPQQKAAVGSFFSPAARSAAETAFSTTAQGATGVAGPALSALGYGAPAVAGTTRPTAPRAARRRMTGVA